MRDHSVRFPLPRFGAVLAAALALILSAGWFTDDLAAQKPKPKEEEEEPVKPKVKPPLRVDDEEPPRQHINSRPLDLRLEAEQATNAAVKDLYLRLAVPHDEVIFPAGTRVVQWIEPLKEYVGPSPGASGTVMWRCIDSKGKAGKVEEVERKKLTAIEHYEALAVAQVDHFFDRARDLSKLEQLQVAEKALLEVVRFHETTRLPPMRRGSDWDPQEKKLRDKLLDVLLKRLQTLAGNKDWIAALGLANQLAEIYPQRAEVRSAVIKVRVQHAEERLVNDKPDTFAEARKALEQLERQFPNSQQEPAARKLRERLQDEAAKFLRKARDAKDKDKGKAIAYLRTAEGIWPQLSGMQELQTTLLPFKALRVGVRHLPEMLSPVTAVTDSERQGVELIFEGLVRPVPDAKVGQRYEPVLAAGSPQLISLGREFQLTRNARWYRPASGAQADDIDAAVTVGDVRGTASLYRLRSAHSPEWTDLLEGAGDVDGDAFRVRVRLRQGYLDPLSLMTFKVLPPQHLRDGKLDDPYFAANPVGSGPFCYLGTRQGDAATGKYAVFQANPRYASRRAQGDLPRLREIHFYRPKDPIGDFRAGALHILLDPSTQQVKELKSPAAGLKNVSIHTLRNRRVWFLAVNHRTNTQLQNDNLRRAIAHAINREKILKDCFRDDFEDESGQLVHRPLNGPYIPGTWACAPNLRPDPFDKTLAKSLAGKPGTPHGPLELLYPTDLPQVEQACQDICSQVEEATGIKLVPKGLPLRELHHRVSVTHNYDLAYYWWDHPTDAYWLWPLFDANAEGKGGPNVLGPLKDQELEQLFLKAMRRREFSEVQKLTRQIHQRLYERMPLIPLWQLDTHIAVHADLTTVPEPRKLDPLLIFTHAEQWRLEK